MNPLSSSSNSSSRIGLLGGSRHEGKAALMVVSLPLLAICSAHNIFIIHSLQSYTTPLFSTTSRSQRALRDWSELDMTFVAQMPILYGWHLEAKRLMRWLDCWFKDVKLILWDFKRPAGFGSEGAPVGSISHEEGDIRSGIGELVDFWLEEVQLGETQIPQTMKLMAVQFEPDAIHVIVKKTFWQCLDDKLVSLWFQLID